MPADSGIPPGWFPGIVDPSRLHSSLGGKSTMNIRVIVLLLTVAVSGCSPDDPHLPGYKAGSGDFTPFVLQSAISCGGRPVKTTGLPKVQGDWRYKADKDGVQIYLVGDYMSQVQTLLLAAFGPPAIAAKTNQDGRVSGARNRRSGPLAFS